MTGSLARSVRSFFEALGPDDRARVGTFGAEIAVGANLTNDPEEAERVLREEYWAAEGVGTPLWQAIGEGIASIANEDERKVVLVLTDGRDSGGLPGWSGSRSAVAKELSRLGGIVYIVRPPSRYRSQQVRPLPRAAIDFAETSGGAHYAVPAAADLHAIFARIAEELRHQYLLGFSPPVLDGREHEIEVRVNRPGARVRARKTYLAGKADR
jgi:Ca-activated chloride channel family protein